MLLISPILFLATYYSVTGIPSNLRSYTVILPKKSELSSKINLREETPPLSRSACDGIKSNIWRRLTSSGYTVVRVFQSFFPPSSVGMQTAQRVPTNPPWKVIKRRLGNTGWINPSWMNCGKPFGIEGKCSLVASRNVFKDLL